MMKWRTVALPLSGVDGRAIVALRLLWSPLDVPEMYVLCNIYLM